MERRSDRFETRVVAISGMSGLVGSALAERLRAAGHRALPLVRRQGAEGVFWDPLAGVVDRGALEGIDAVVHLAGENVGGGRWTAARKRRIRDSRVRGTELLAEALAGLEHPPECWLSASAIGYYGDRGDELLNEDSPPGTGFLSEVCQAWETATAAAEEAGLRVVRLRIGVVLTPRGGALERMLTPFGLGLGGVLGHGRQWVSWIALDDLVSAIVHVLETGASGALNAVAPRPVDNRGLTRALGRVLRRPTVLPVPAAALRLALGEMAEELLLSSTRVDPSRLLESGFVPRFADLEEALRHLLGRPS